NRHASPCLNSTVCSKGSCTAVAQHRFRASTELIPELLPAGDSNVPDRMRAWQRAHSYLVVFWRYHGWLVPVPLLSRQVTDRSKHRASAGSGLRLASPWEQALLAEGAVRAEAAA